MVSHHTTITSKRTVEGKVKYRAGFILTSMNGEFKGKVAEAGKKTRRGRVELTLNFDTPGTYAVKCNQKTKKGSAMRAAKKKFC
ncbi:hypothetical protein [Streptomyces synnematoformans]|uniref:Bacterial Ig domain-containing protein n=1 Tax=Streptomyces synnematoformans TaxID=415721 RepID=A0ABN1ZXG5_9ACTN